MRGMCNRFFLYSIVGCCALAVLPGCSRKLHNLPDKLKPLPWIFDMEPKGLSPQMSQAWKDGCESGLASMTNSYYRANYKFKMDPGLRKIPEYYKFWKDIYNFCRHYTYGRTREANMRFALPDQQSSTLTKVGIHPVFERGLLNFWGPSGFAGVPLENFGYIEGQKWIGDGEHTNWDFSEPYYYATTGLHGVLNWDLRPTQGFVW